MLPSLCLGSRRELEAGLWRRVARAVDSHAAGVKGLADDTVRRHPQALLRHAQAERHVEADRWPGDLVGLVVKARDRLGGDRDKPLGHPQRHARIVGLEHHFVRHRCRFFGWAVAQAG